MLPCHRVSWSTVAYSAALMQQRTKQKQDQNERRGSAKYGFYRRSCIYERHRCVAAQRAVEKSVGDFDIAQEISASWRVAGVRVCVAFVVAAFVDQRQAIGLTTPQTSASLCARSNRFANKLDSILCDISGATRNEKKQGMPKGIETTNETTKRT